MSTRNPLNERYQNDGHRGVTKKSAASAKPKTKAAASVYIQPKEKTPQQKKAARKAQRAKQQARTQMYYNPKTPRYKFLRKLWWVLLGIAIVITIVSFAFQSSLPTNVTWGLIIASYVCIIAAFVLEFTVIKKERNRYAASMGHGKSKAARTEQKKAKAEQRAQKAEAKEKFDEAQAAELEKPKGFKRLFAKRTESENDSEAESAAEAKPESDAK